MIRSVRIENYKSIADLALELGRVNVLIGANGSGKSNILEAIALASAAAQNKLDNEFLISRGVRLTETRFMRSAFAASTSCDGQGEQSETIQVAIKADNQVVFGCKLLADETASYPKWTEHGTKTGPVSLSEISLILKKIIEEIGPSISAEDRARLQAAGEKLVSPVIQLDVARPHSSLDRHEIQQRLSGFLVYAPENSALRTFQAEGQILPLGIRGEGLFAHLKGLNSDRNRERLAKIKESLKLIEWFESFEIPDDLSPGERSIRIQDNYLPTGALFDQRSANEGFLFLLFYITLLISPETPAFFSIDNIDTSLNPKLCVALLQQFVALSKEHDKQVILTTHNPAVLDGLDLHDDEQRLLVVDRDKNGFTRVRRVNPPKPSAGEATVSLSEAFMRGYIGGLPKNF